LIIAQTLPEQRQSHLVFAKKKTKSEITTGPISNSSNNVNSGKRNETVPPRPCPDGSGTLNRECFCPDRSSPVSNKCPTPTPKPPSPGSLTSLDVVKNVINNNVGTKNPSDFAIAVSGNSPSPNSFSGSSSGTAVTLKAGSYKVTESVVSGYTASYSSGCSGIAKGGVPIKCTITNVFQPAPKIGKLIVTKKVMNNGVDDKNPSDFAIAVSGNSPSPSSFPAKQGGTTVLLRAGQYKVTESGPSGYTSSFSSDCAGRMDSDQIRICNITNEAKQLPLVVTTIKGFSGPAGLAYDSANKDVYVTNYGNKNDLGGKVSVLHSSTDTIIDTIPVGTRPQAIAYNPANNDVYVANTLSNNVSVISTLNNNVISTIAVANLPGNGSSGIAYDFGNGKIYVTNFGSGTVSAIDSSTNKVVDNIKGFFGPVGVAYDSSNGKIYVTNKEADTVSVVDTLRNNVIATIPVGAAPSAIAYDPANDRIYVTNSGLVTARGTVSVVEGSTNKVIATIPVGVGPDGVAYDPDNARIYVANSFSNSITVIDGSSNNPIATIAVGTQPHGVVYNPANHNIYVANYDSNTISVIHQ
jgi:YVTN family beta-propeller protein